MKKQSKNKDPQYDREAQQYSKPVPSREYILDYLKDVGRPLSYEEIIEALDIDDEDSLEGMRRRLIAMVRDGQLVKNRKNKYGLIDKLDLMKGFVVGHPEGHGFFVEEHSNDKYFLSQREMNVVFDGDRILARFKQYLRNGRGEVTIARVLERKHQIVVGQYFIESGVGFLVPENNRIPHDIVIPEEPDPHVKHGDVVKAEIIAPPTARTQAVARVTEVLGQERAPGMETEIAIHAYDLPSEFPDEVLQQAQQLPDEVDTSNLEDERVDLRDKAFVTIDGEDAKDFDDAVYCEKRRSSGWTLYVAIADVSHYVTPDSALDQEAYKRGNSVYFPTRVVPMLPEKLSNGLCSLNPDVDRMVLVCQMNITKNGKRTNYRFYPAIIQSQSRLTYTIAAQLFEGDDTDLIQQYQSVYPHLIRLYELYQAVHGRRIEQGLIDFDLNDPKVIFGEDQKIQSLVKEERNEAHRLIEECMLLANVSAADYLSKQKQAALYRVHPKPESDKVEQLQTFLRELGLGLAGGLSPEPEDYARVLDKARERTDFQVIQMAILQSMQQAYYSATNHGHFGLNFESYAHFTSPIRRYPDLIVHRAIYRALKGQKATKQQREHVESIGVHCSMTERRAEDATRDVMSWLKCEFMLDKVGQEFAGVIASVTSFGLFVQLESFFIDGLIHISALENDYYRFDSVRKRLVGERTGMIYNIGDKLKVTVANVDLDQRQIDFTPIIKPSHKKRPKKKSTKKKKQS